MKVELKAVHSLEKVFHNSRWDELLPAGTPDGFGNEPIHFQLAVRIPAAVSSIAVVRVSGPIRKNVSVRSVAEVPVRLACYDYVEDDDYISREPGLYPDLLNPVTKGRFRIYCNQPAALWIEVDPAGLEPGEYPVTFTVSPDNEGVKGARLTVPVKVRKGLLDKQDVQHLKWFHADAIADYYHVKPFSKKHMDICEAFLRQGAKRSVNTSLVPIHTPSTDTRVGGERTTTQLVDITIRNGEISFNMDKLDKWIEMMQRAGIEYFQITQLFTQWGAAHPPKIMATVDGHYKRLFTWNNDLHDGQYKAFLDKYLPAVIAELKKLGVLDRCAFAISDEPHGDQLESYAYARSLVAEHLKDLPISDALSDYEFYAKGVVDRPCAATNCIDPFIEHGVKDLWAYYCCGQNTKVSNMFMSMPSRRNRVLGLQLYLYNIKGFLQWAFDFYNSQYSDYKINPFLDTCGDGFVPSGDTFQVYPGPDGKPLESIRMVVTGQAFDDVRAFKTLERLAGRETVEKLIYKDYGDKITFSEYPRCNEYFVKLRQAVNDAIEERM